MAAIYSGIHLKLKSPGTPWENKLKLARFAFISPQCLLPNKEQVLLDWTTHALTGFYNKKVEFSQSVLKGLWCYLDDLLHSKKLHSLLSQGKNITLKLNVKQALLDRLQECLCDGPEPSVSLSTLLSVCKGILSSPTLSSILTTKYELLAELMAKLCCLACYKLQHRDSAPPALASKPGSEPAPSQDEPTLMFEVLLQVLSCYLSIQRQQVNAHRVFTVVTNQLLQPVVLLRHLLTSAEPTPSLPSQRLRPQLSRDIRGKMDSILQLALFPTEQLGSYKEELVPVKAETGKVGPGGAKGQPKPLKIILTKLGAQGYCDASLHYAVRTNALSLLFKLCLDSYGKGGTGVNEEPRMLCFRFLTHLLPALDLGLGSSAVPGPSDQTTQPESWSQALLTLENLLNQALSSDIYNVAADRIRHGEVQLLFYRGLVQILFSHAQQSIPAWYRCLKVLLGLNHLIVEPELDQLLSLAWVDSDCMDSRVQRARQLLVCNLLQTYTKLHQLPRLFTELLSVVCWPASDQLRPTLLTDEICTSIKTCLLDASASQATEICALTLESINRYILPDLLDDDQGEDKESEMSGGEAGAEAGDVKMDQGGGVLDGERGDASLKLVSHSQLLHAVLFSLKTLDNASPVPLVRQTTKLMGVMGHLVDTLLKLVTSESTRMDTDDDDPSTSKTEESEPGQDTEPCTQWKQKTTEAALLLRYTWVEVDALFHIHCSKYTSLESPLSPALGKADDQELPSSLVLSRLKEFLSGEVLPGMFLPFPSKSSDSTTSGWLLKLLALQQFKKVLLDSHLLAKAETAAILSSAAQFILAKEELLASLEKEQDADRETNKGPNSYPVAHWYLVTSSLPLIASYLSVGDEGCVADVVLRSMLSRRTKENTDWLPVLCGSQSISAISSQLLQSHFYVELPSLYSSTVKSLTQRIITVLQMSPETDLPTKGSPPSPSDKAIQALADVEALVEVILGSSQTREASIVVSHAQTQELLSLMDLAANLNPDGINAEDLTHLFLLLLFVLTSTTSPPEGPAGVTDNPGNDTLFLGKLLGLLTGLMEGSHFQSVLKQIHGSSVLQAVVSSILARSGKAGRSSTGDSGWMDLVKAVQGFIKSLVHCIIIRNSSVRLNLDQFTSYLASQRIAGMETIWPQTEPSTPTVTVSEAPEAPDIPSLQLLLASLTSFSKTMARCLGRSKPMDQTLSATIRKSTAALGPIIETVLKSQAVSRPASVLGQAFLVEVVTVMLQCELSAVPVDPGAKPSSAHTALYHSFCQQILKEIHSAPRPKDFLLSSLRFLSAFYCMVKRNAGEKSGGDEVDELFTRMLQTVFTLLAADWLSLSDLCGLEPAVEDLLGHLLDGSTTGQFNLLLLLIREGLDSSKLEAGSYKEVLSAVTTTKLLSRCGMPEACSRALWLIAPQIISSMVFVVRSSSQDPTLSQALTVPTLTSMTSLLNQGEGLISSPHHVTLVLAALQLVPLERLPPPAYRSAFHAVHETLFAVVSCHPQVLVSTAPTFLTVFYRLVASIMHEGRQKGDSDTGPDGDVYLQCSMLLERMYTHIAAAAEVFTNFAPFIVSQYVTELQKVTLRPDVKLRVTEGIYQIMDLCIERDIKFLTAGLQPGVREVFNELYASYSHYHKAQRQGEDKYTAA
ncbi:unhealthy ribosome biogenesis protein 2 homolog [Gadus macrocephalus]|uniref:unhealthy ribosome biogenesis protein 2 homolog n=1 Tax=Gadus macrocephalus TaxID=80720 RepID=UPI0028CB7410|nr:unhealthy ribosome biogenesis protein 2 homolog [Gadus macrocephalus]XP_059927022.1 unhealthy ribosome biogenesis protein 2 homolog [Gadus macrocephalus]XP_059927023.1 unhealthy ribosome biogenesis protein 2 homolog [Gadus macrocephalus]XP_059927024.1 unhealthy ribosome biogenesis protein 2 homolog [Gadus macrocephalus]XP_059927025.1 unhealthy ribosome biogenesis protein 2 homolog [Gadus macrocephalus]